MTQHETPRRQRHRRAGQDRGRQRGQAQKTLGALQRRADLRTRIAHILHLLVAGKFPLQLRTQSCHLLRLARDHQAIRDTATFLQQFGRCQVRIVQQHARRETRKTDGLVDVLHDARRHREAPRTDAHLIAHLYIETTQQTLIRPHHTACRNHLRHMQVAVVDLDLAAQGIARFHRLQLAQQHLPAMRHHAGEGAALHHLQTARGRQLAIVGREHTRGRDAQIGPDQTLRLLLQRLPHTVGE